MGAAIVLHVSCATLYVKRTHAKMQSLLYIYTDHVYLCMLKVPYSMPLPSHRRITTDHILYRMNYM